jgi:transposase
LRLRDDLLAPIAWLAGGRGLEAVAARVAQPAPGRRPDRLDPGCRRRIVGGGKKGGDATGPNPTDRGKPGTKRHLVSDANGIPLAEFITAANVNEVTLLAELLDAVPPVRGKEGRPRRRPDKLHGDKGYRSRKNQRLLRARGILSRIARPKIESSEKLGRHRWVVERTFAWLNQMKRLVIRYERRADIHEAFFTLGCCMICFKFLEPTFC